MLPVPESEKPILLVFFGMASSNVRLSFESSRSRLRLSSRLLREIKPLFPTTLHVTLTLT
jgi:hypothetical protein